MNRTTTKPRLPTASALEDAWLREEVRTAIAKARAVVDGGAVPPLTPVGRLSDTEWGWIIGAVVFGWISARARHAVNNGVGNDAYLRDAAIAREAWDIGAIEAALPELGAGELDWNKSLAQFTREEMIAFLLDAHTLITEAMRARDRGETLITRKGPGGEISADPALPF